MIFNSNLTLFAVENLILFSKNLFKISNVCLCTVNLFRQMLQGFSFSLFEKDSFHKNNFHSLLKILKK